MSESQSWPGRIPVLRYGLAVEAVAIALGIKLVLLQFNVQYPLRSSFVAAIAITFWDGAHLVDLTHVSVFARDTRNVITYWNRDAEVQHGWTSETTVGQVSHDILRTTCPD